MFFVVMWSKSRGFRICFFFVYWWNMFVGVVNSILYCRVILIVFLLGLIGYGVLWVLIIFLKLLMVGMCWFCRIGISCIICV